MAAILDLTSRIITTQKLAKFWEGAKTKVHEWFYTKDDIDSKVSTLEKAIQDAAASRMSIEIVDAVPSVEDAVANVVYFVPKQDAEQDNVYDQFTLINGKMEALGSTEVQLGNYVRNEDIVEATDDDIDAIFAEAAGEE